MSNKPKDETDRNVGSPSLPDLLTQEEAIKLLRLDQLGIKNPKETLRHLRRTRQLGYVKVAGKVLIPREEIEAYVKRHAHRNAVVIVWRRVWIWKRTLKAGVVYCLRWHDEHGRVRTETVGSNRRLAEELQHKRERRLNAGGLRATSRMTYEEFQTEEFAAMKGRLAPGVARGARAHAQALWQFLRRQEKIGPNCGARL